MARRNRLEISTHIDLILAAEVAAGRQPSTTPVGTVRFKDHDSGNVWFETQFVHFEKDGAPRVSADGKTRLNHRKQW